MFVRVVSTLGYCFYYCLYGFGSFVLTTYRSFALATLHPKYSWAGLVTQEMHYVHQVILITRRDRTVLRIPNTICSWLLPSPYQTRWNRDLDNIYSGLLVLMFFAPAQQRTSNVVNRWCSDFCIHSTLELIRASAAFACKCRGSEEPFHSFTGCQGKPRPGYVFVSCMS